MQAPRAGGPVVSNSLGFYWPVLLVAGPGKSLDLGRMCPLPELNTLAKNFQTKGRDIFSHGLLGPPERGTGWNTQEVRKKQRKLAVKHLKRPNIATGLWLPHTHPPQSRFSTLMRHSIGCT